MSRILKTELDFKIYESARLYGVKEKLQIARQHKITYMTMNESAFLEIQPLINYLLKKKKFDEALKYLRENTTDCVERGLLFHRIFQEKKMYKHKRDKA